MGGPTLPISCETHAAKYRGENESFEDGMWRIANALKDDEIHRREFETILCEMRFMPGGRIQAAMGAPKVVTPYNCFHRDTEIATDTGFVRLGDHVGETLQVLSPVSGSFHPAIVKTYGEQELFDVTISTSSKNDSRHETFTVHATRDHRWVLQSDEVTTALAVGHILKAGDCRIPASKAGFTHGFVYGDGTKQREGKFLLRLCGEKQKHLRDILEGADTASVTYPPSNDGDPNVTILSDTDLKALPTGVDAAYLRGFVQGLLAADGCFKVRPQDAFVFSGTEKTVRWVRDHLVYAGYAPCGRAHEAATESTNFGERNVPIWRQLFRLSDEHKGYRVVSITSIGVDTVYCVEEPEHRQIVLRNGLRSGQCFVSGTIDDSLCDGTASIMARVTEAAQTMRLGGGIGYDFSTLRPENAIIKKLGSRSSGPISFMGIFDATCHTIASAGHRRGAQMGVLRVDHPDIMKFIHAKRDERSLTGFNISVAVTDEFMECLAKGKPFKLRFGGQIYAEVDPAELWDAIMQNTWDYAEPGVLFIDQINRMNNLWYCETIAATNPCGEQPLPPHGACLLGSFNLTRYVKKGTWDFDQLEKDIPQVVRAMDNVVDRAEYPLPQQGREARAKRRMGLGVTGLANAVEYMGAQYGSNTFVNTASEVMHFINRQAYLASVQLAKEKGVFAMFNAEHYLDSGFAKTLDQDVRRAIKKHGIRNSHLTSIAPTGTISLCADNVSSGIEPVFAHEYDRTINMPDGKRIETVTDYGVRVFKVKGKRAADVTPNEHVAVLIAAQANVDSAVSKTCNIGDDVSFDDFKSVYLNAYEGGAKGCTTFRAAGMRKGILNEKPAEQEAEGGACKYDPTTGMRSCE